MNILVVFDSYFGNTEKIARAIENSFNETHSVKIVRVQDFSSDLLKDADLIVAGSPTRAFSPSEHFKKFLEQLPAKSLSGKKFAAFDTRIDTAEIKSGFLKFMSKTFGYAAPSMAKKLTGKGGEQVLQPAGFYVKDSEGPLKDGEEERAARWLKELFA